MCTIGNGNARRAYSSAPPKIQAGSPFDVKLARARAIYENKSYGPDYTFLVGPPQLKPEPQRANLIVFDNDSEHKELRDAPVQFKQDEPCKVKVSQTTYTVGVDNFFAQFGL